VLLLRKLGTGFCAMGIEGLAVRASTCRGVRVSFLGHSMSARPIVDCDGRETMVVRRCSADEHVRGYGIPGARVCE